MLTLSSNNILKLFTFEVETLFLSQAVKQKSKLHAVNSTTETRTKILSEYLCTLFVQDMQRSETDYKAVEWKILSMITHENNKQTVNCLNKVQCVQSQELNEYTVNIIKIRFGFDFEQVQAFHKIQIRFIDRMQCFSQQSELTKKMLNLRLRIQISLDQSEASIEIC